MISAAGLL